MYAGMTPNPMRKQQKYRIWNVTAGRPGTSSRVYNEVQIFQDEHLEHYDVDDHDFRDPIGCQSKEGAFVQCTSLNAVGGRTCTVRSHQYLEDYVKSTEPS